MQQAKPNSLWDEGISGFLEEEYRRRKVPLTMADLQEFAGEHAMRISDIVETLILMVNHGAWRYSDADGNALPLDEEALNATYVNARMSRDDLMKFTGVWQPV